MYAAPETMPGASAGTIATAARVGKGQVYALLRDGFADGELTSVEFGSGLTGYQIVRPVESAFAPAAPAHELDALAAPVAE